MNLKTILTLVVLMLTVNAAFASFPVQRQAKVASSQTEISVTDEDNEIITPVFASEKSQGIALLLAIFLGLLAGHRWYLGSPWPINLIFIFSLGGFGIWLIIDIVRICTKDLTPAKGRYKKSFF